MISVIVPVYNEEKGVAETLKKLVKVLRKYKKSEIIVVDDGSIDKSLKEIEKLKIAKLRLIKHTQKLGYGKSISDGILISKNKYIGIIDGDGTYQPKEFENFLVFLPDFDMVVGTRKGKEFKKNIFKNPARTFFRFLVEYATGTKIEDINSGLRIFKKEKVMEFKDKLCTGFSFTTTITLYFLLNQFYIKYLPINYLKRKGRSKVRKWRDTLRALQIIVQAILYYNPIKLFLLVGFFSVFIGILLESVNYFLFKNLFISLVSSLFLGSFFVIFSLGLVADMISSKN